LNALTCYCEAREVARGPITADYRMKVLWDGSMPPPPPPY